MADKKLESVAKAKVKRELEKLGYVSKSAAMAGKAHRGIYYPHPATAFGVAGAPDLYVFGNGRVLFIECKSTVGKLSPIQEMSLNLMSSLGIKTLVYKPETTLEELRDYLSMALGVL